MAVSLYPALKSVGAKTMVISNSSGYWSSMTRYDFLLVFCSDLTWQSKWKLNCSWDTSQKSAKMILNSNNNNKKKNIVDIHRAAVSTYMAKN